MSVDRYTTTRMPSARAIGAPSVMAGTYTGAELQTRSSRPGAYDALALPSREGQRLIKPGERPAPAEVLDEPRPIEPAPLLHRAAPPTMPTYAVPRKAPSTYTPRVGSVPFRLIQTLRQDGGHLSMAEIARKYDANPHSVTAILKSAIDGKALIKHKVGGHVYISLPGYVMPAIEAPAPMAGVATPPPPFPAAQAPRKATPKTDAAAALQRLAQTAFGLATAMAQLEAQTLVVATLIGEALKRLSAPSSTHAAGGR